MALNRIEKQRLVKAAHARQVKENELLDDLALAVGAFLELAVSAAERSLPAHSPQALLAAIDSDDIENLAAQAELYVNPRTEDEPLTTIELLAIWGAVLAMFPLTTDRPLPTPLDQVDTSTAVPMLAAEKLRAIFEETAAQQLPRGAALTAVREELALKNSLPAVKRAESRGVPLPEGTSFDSWVSTTARSTATEESSLSQIEALAAEGKDKMWASIWLDDRVRPSHLNAHEQVKPAEVPFNVGDTLLMYPGDPHGPLEEIASCRCVVIEPDRPGSTSRNPLGLDV